MSGHVASIEDVVGIAERAREHSQRMMSISKPTLNECGLWAAVELLADCVAFLAAERES